MSTSQAKKSALSGLKFVIQNYGKLGSESMEIAALDTAIQNGEIHRINKVKFSLTREMVKVIYSWYISLAKRKGLL